MKPKVVIFGTPQFAIPSIQAAVDFGEVLAAVTQPDRPKGRGLKVKPCEVKEFASSKGIPVFSPERLGSTGGQDAENLFQHLSQLKPDLFLVTAYGNLLPQRFLDIPRLGSFNVHASLLPKWRGAAPIQRSLEFGDSETGVCLQKMVMSLDAGDVFKEIRYQITDQDNATSLFHKLSELGYHLVRELLQTISKGQTIDLTPQDPSKVSIAPKITKEEGFWRSNWTANELSLKVRAFQMWPGVKVFSKLLNSELSLEEVSRPVRISSTGIKTNIRTGEFTLVDGKVYLACQSRTGEQSKDIEFVEIIELKVPGKGKVKASAFFTSEFNKQNISKSEFFEIPKQN